MENSELSKELHEEKTIRWLKNKIEDLTAENEQYERDYNKVLELLKKASNLVGNPCTNISSSTDTACDNWQEDYKKLIEKENDNN